MGLLDDAIREHLELKRRHGADPSEVERQEHEALGPARRTAAPATDTAYDEDDLPAGAIDDEDDPDGLFDDDDDEFAFDDEPPVASVPLAEREAPVAPPAPRERESEVRERNERFEREPSDGAAEIVDDLEPVDADDLEPPPAADRAAGEEHGDDQPPERGEDVLEETPEFLQETPEHDRLWFEQKPPRDFEF
jgi:hypothetical protein